MVDKVKVDLEENSKFRVALELAQSIHLAEVSHKADAKQRYETDPRNYWLSLYAQCRKVVVESYDAKSAQKEHG